MSQQPFGDIPLFRELQRLLASGGGPINKELARQIAGAISAQRPDAPPSPAAQQSVDAAVHESAAMLAGYTRLAPDEPLRARVISRTEWIDSTLEGWSWLFEGLAERFGAAEVGGEGPLGPVLGQITPLLMGMQAGSLIGHVSLDALSRYDLPMPRDDDGSLFLVEPNIAYVAESYDLDAELLRRWLATRDAARHLIVRAVPWSMRYLRSVMAELIASIEVDTAELERRLGEMQAGGFASLQEGVSTGDLIPIAETERHQRARITVRGFLAIFEGYAQHAASAVRAADANDARVGEAMARHAASPSEGRSMLAALLGLELDRSLQAAGVTFCNAVAELRSIAALNRMWDAPDNLPSLPEIRDPFAWIERVLDASEDPGELEGPES